MPHPAWFQEVMRDAAHTAFTSAFWDTIDRERDDLDEDDEDTLPNYGAGTELCGYTDRIPEEDLDEIAACYDAILTHYQRVSFWQLCEYVFTLDERCPAPSLFKRVDRAVGSHFLGMLGHGVNFWDNEMDERDAAEKKFPGLREDHIYRGFDEITKKGPEHYVPDPESILEKMVDKHRRTISQTLPWGDSLRPPPPPPHS